MLETSKTGFSFKTKPRNSITVSAAVSKIACSGSNPDSSARYKGITNKSVVPLLYTRCKKNKTDKK